MRARVGSQKHIKIDTLDCSYRKRHRVHFKYSGHKLDFLPFSLRTIVINVRMSVVDTFSYTFLNVLYMKKYLLS